ncbi:LysM peptidoglycan-binding domain-containing M23 family metallopeptidase [Deinococcus arenicola]|uniref:LysM peptidoglycan-binding domain-containing M23 family metallopeptidase n=1 Tax=Deinococcus arenicola TaxID=2994950 RepID=A0ABU4DVQ3_9DEIO|nr:LysM peptidoglycan-binding domain-containing M23 family metallopeptidase [Deinococcus sp. ZS9-10]MDV6376533.1 LysM peptidoglycan-binding domain-containing M23 family metallopeptidase [Deinococcus sp. ZS9-10]
MTHRPAFLLSLALLSGVAGAYTVRAGDTLSSIARANNTSVNAILRLNKLAGDALEIGQELRIPGQAPATSTAPGSAVPVSAATPQVTLSKPVLPQPLPPEQLTPTPPSVTIAGVSVRVPQSLRMGDAFTVHLSGARAGQATVRFPSEVGEDVRQPNEILKPIGGAGEYVVVGRVVLGKTTPVVYEVSLGGELIRGRIPVTGLDQPTQYLNLPARISAVLEDPERVFEDAAVEQAYALRTPQVWTRPFSPALATARATSSSFGQPRTYMAGGPVAYHFGTDSPAPVGTSVLAVNDGKVILAAKYPVRGNLVVIDHGAGVTSLYFHQSKLVVKPGQLVKRGQKVGEVGTTGLSAGPHLHLELRVRGEGTSPAGWMDRLWPK